MCMCMAPRSTCVCVCVWPLGVHAYAYVYGLPADGAAVDHLAAAAARLVAALEHQVLAHLPAHGAKQLTLGSSLGGRQVGETGCWVRGSEYPIWLFYLNAKPKVTATPSHHTVPHVIISPHRTSCDHLTACDASGVPPTPSPRRSL